LFEVQNVTKILSAVKHFGPSSMTPRVLYTNILYTTNSEFHAGHTS